MSIDQIKADMIQKLGFKEDEISTLFKSDEEIQAFWNDAQKLSGKGTGEAEDKEEGELKDTYLLTEQAKRDLVMPKLEERKVKTAMRTEAKEKFEAVDQTQFPESERVSYKDFMKNLKEGTNLLE